MMRMIKLCITGCWSCNDDDNDENYKNNEDDNDASQGVGVAMVSARLMAHSEIKYRQLGVLLFKVLP